MKKVKFISDFAVKRIGDVIECDSQQASHLVNIDKVAEYTKEEVTKVVLNQNYIAVESEVGKKTFEIVKEQESKVNDTKEEVTKVVPNTKKPK